MKKLLLFLLVLTATQASAQYVSQGPRGGKAFHFYVDAGRVWLAAGGGLFYSLDHGISWRITDKPPIAASCEDLLCVAAFGNDVFVGAQQAGILHSVDGGATWSLPGAGIMRGFPYTDIEISASNAIAIRGDNGDLMVSSDHGSSWNKLNFAILNAKARSLSLHNNALYVSASLGLFKSVDNGQTYTNINSSLADTGEIAWSHDTMYVATSSGLKMSIDDGMTLTPLGLAGTPLKQVAADGRNIYVSVPSAAEDTLKISTDGGLNFSNAAFNPIPFADVLDLTFSNGVAIVGTDQGMFRAAASPLAKADSGFHATVINALAVNGLRLYAATSPMGVFYTADSAEHWANIGGRAQGVPGDMLSIDARNQYVHAGGLSGYFRSQNFGTSWSAGATGLPSGLINSVYAIKGTSDVLALQSGNLYLSTNDGSSFAALSSSLPAGNSYLITQADTALFVASYLGLFKSSGGYNFAPTIGLSGSVSSIVFYNGKFYAGTYSNGLYVSPDGMTWTAAVIAPGVLPVQIHALAVKGNALFAGTEIGLYTDSTGTWTQDSLAGQIVHSLAVMNGKLYAGTCSGVWSQKNLPPPPVVSVPGIQRMDHLFAAYPNPAQNELNVRFQSDKAEPASLSMQDMMGRNIWTRSVDLKPGGNEWRISSEISSMPAGIYFLQITAGAKSAQQKIALQGR